VGLADHPVSRNAAELLGNLPCAEAALPKQLQLLDAFVSPRYGRFYFFAALPKRGIRSNSKR
jgi:hypothetical protein